MTEAFGIAFMQVWGDLVKQIKKELTFAVVADVSFFMQQTVSSETKAGLSEAVVTRT